jgi:hypothetical protein
MDRADIVARMSLREKEIFEKYKDTYPFPIREFAEELDIKIIEEIADSLGGKIGRENGVFCITIYTPRKPIINKKMDLLHINTVITMIVMNLFFEEETPANDIATLRACAFLMPRETFVKIGQELAEKSNFSCKKIGEYFGIPPSAAEFYMNYLMNTMNEYYEFR